MLGKLSCNVSRTYPTIDVMSVDAQKTHWEQFGSWIRKERRNADLTQKQVADRAGIHEVQLARIEKGESGTKRETVIEIANAIGADVETALRFAGFALTPLAMEMKRYGFRVRGEKPTTLPELLEALDDLGIAIEWATIKDSFDGYTPDDFEDLKEQIAANAGVKIRRVINKKEN